MIDSTALSFDKEDDFSRKHIAENMKKLLLSEIDISPLVIDGDWGTGKTYFCKKLKNLIVSDEDLHVNCGYIDAFIADHANEPLLTIISEVSKLIDGKNNKKEFLEKAKSVASYSLKTLGKAGISWVLRQDPEEVTAGFTESIKKASNDAIDFSIEKLLKLHVDNEDNIIALQQVLKDATESKELIIFIDELDRCRPDFAVSILEIIKHIFNVDKVKFVLVTNFSQLTAAVKHSYGDTIDAHRYLDKFIKFRFELPKYMSDENNKLIYTSCKQGKLLINKSKTLDKNIFSNSVDLEMINDLIIYNELSLREVETFIRMIEVYNIISSIQAKNKQNNYKFDFDLILMAIFIFCIKPDLKKDFEKKIIKSIQLCNLLGVSSHTKSAAFQYVSHRKKIASYLMIIINDKSVDKFDPDDKEDIKNWEERFCFNLSRQRKEDLIGIFLNVFNKLSFH